MREAWHIVEVYCFISIVKMIADINYYSSDMTALAIGLGGRIAVIVLSFLVFRGKRAAAKLLAAYIVVGVFASVLSEGEAYQKIDIFMVYRAFVLAYFFIGAIKLWRIKELPTRFTDPPADQQANH